MRHWEFFIEIRQRYHYLLVLMSMTHTHTHAHTRTCQVMTVFLISLGAACLSRNLLTRSDEVSCSTGKRMTQTQQQVECLILRQQLQTLYHSGPPGIQWKSAGGKTVPYSAETNQTTWWPSSQADVLILGSSINLLSLSVSGQECPGVCECVCLCFGCGKQLKQYSVTVFNNSFI